MAVMKEDYDDMRGEMKEFAQRTDKKLDAISTTLTEARGGWRVFMLIGGACMAVGGAIVKFVPLIIR